jgi:signal transduction histidine kinase
MFLFPMDTRSDLCSTPFDPLLPTPRESTTVCLSHEHLSTFFHEVRNPVTTLHTLIKLLQKRLNSQDANQWIGQSLEKECLHLQKLLNKFEEEFQVQSISDPEPIPVLDFLQMLVPTYEALALEHGLTFSFTVDPTSLYPPLTLDPLALRQVLNNLVDNACKYTPPPGHLYLKLSRESQDLVITLNDTGSGIQPEVIPYIFQPHFQSDQTKPGQGLGLAISRNLVEQMGGHIEVDSYPGQGSSFRIRFPIPDGG